MYFNENQAVIVNKVAKKKLQKHAVEKHKHLFLGVCAQTCIWIGPALKDLS